MPDENRDTLIPVPDPSDRSIEALHREIRHMNEMLDQKIMAVKDQIEAVDRRQSEQLDADIKALYAEIVSRDKSVSLALTAAQDAVNKALDSAQKAVDKSEVAADKRFESVNEFRGQLSDQVRNFVPREVFETAMADLRNRVDRNTDALSSNTGKDAGQDAAAAAADKSATRLIAAVSVGVAIISVIIVLANVLTGR